MEETKIDDFLAGTDDTGNEDQPGQVRYEISSYGADFDVIGLVRRFNEGSIDLPPFQRAFVWSKNQASQFIESLLIGLPVPGVFMFRDTETSILKIIDGQQRLTSLRFFINGYFEDQIKPFALSGIKSQYKDVGYSNLSEEDRRRFDDSIIHATIVKQEHPEDDYSSTFELYRRINRSGSPLTDQEIRNAIRQGELNDLLKELTSNEAWRSVFGTRNKRMREEELVLRFFALFFDLKGYERPMYEFLNNFMLSNLNLKKHSRKKLVNLFQTTINVVSEGLGSRAFRKTYRLNVAAFDSMMIGLAKRLENGGIKDVDAISTAHDRLLDNEKYDSLISDTTSAPDNVNQRIDMAIKAFSKLK